MLVVTTIQVVSGKAHLPGELRTIKRVFQANHKIFEISSFKVLKNTDKVLKNMRRIGVKRYMVVL
jgi:hypothetical protein